MNRVHQNIVINGIDYGDHKSRKNSKFCNEGKWNNFILPLLPKDCSDMTFLELGSNAGLYLKMATEKGFRNVFGLEQSRKDIEMAQLYRDSLKMNYKLMQGAITNEFDYNQFPLSDVTLLANFHYHLTTEDFPTLLDSMEHKTRYCLVVSVKKPPPVHWRIDSRIDAVRRYFRDWKEVGEVLPISTEGDPHPREGMYSVMFESKLKRLNLDNIKRPDGNPIQYSNALCGFILQTINEKTFNLEKSMYFRKVHHQKIRKMSIEEIYKFVEERREVVLDIIKNGFKRPIIVNKDYNLLDGGFRVTVAKVLGYNSIIGRIL